MYLVLVAKASNQLIIIKWRLSKLSLRTLKFQFEFGANKLNKREWNQIMYIG